MTGLTARQKQMLEFIRQFQVDHEYAPSIREIGEHMGIRSTNGVSDHLRALQRKGVLELQPGKARTAKIVGANRSPVEIVGRAGTVETSFRISIDVPSSHRVGAIAQVAATFTKDERINLATRILRMCQ